MSTAKALVSVILIWLRKIGLLRIYGFEPVQPALTDACTKYMIVPSPKKPFEFPGGKGMALPIAGEICVCMYRRMRFSSTYQGPR